MRAKRRLSLLLTLSSIGSLLVLGLNPASAWAFTKPATTTSIYECGTSPISTFQQQGVTQAQNGRSGLVILDFGRPAYDATRGGTGYLTPSASGCTAFITRANVLSDMEGYAASWYFASGFTSQLQLAIGTNNSCNLGDPCGNVQSCGCSYDPTDLNRWGVEMAQDAQTLKNYVATLGQITAAAADDAEPAYDPSNTNTRSVMAGFNSTSALWMYDYGSADSTWSQNTIADIAWGVNVAAGNRVDYPDNFPVPEIYFQSQADEWARIDCYDRTHGVSMVITGVMTQYPADFTYQQGYDAMLGDLNSTAYCNAAGAQSSIAYSTNI